MKLSRNTKIFSFFFAASVLVTLFHFLFHPVRVLGMETSIFYMDEAISLAAFFSTLVLFLTGYVFLTGLHRIKDRLLKSLYLILGLFFVYLSFDEYFEIHEYLNTFIKMSLSQNILGLLANYSWVISLGVLVLLAFLAFFAVLYFEKDRKVKMPVFLGVIAFFFVLVFEMLGAATYGMDIYLLFVGIEEFMEMAGASLFLLAALNKTSSLT